MNKLFLLYTGLVLCLYSMEYSQESVYSGLAVFKNAENLVEEMWDLNFAKGEEDIFFRLPIDEINKLEYNFVIVKDGLPCSNNELENNTFYIKYSEVEKEDENTGGSIIERKILKISLNTGKYGVAGIDYDYLVNDLVEQLKSDIKNADKNAIADMIYFPLQNIKDRKTFLKLYNRIFTKECKESIFSKNDLFCNYQGVMLGNGNIWLNLIDNQIKITTINY